MTLSDYVDILFKLTILAIVLFGLAGCLLFALALIATAPW